MTRVSASACSCSVVPFPMLVIRQVSTACAAYVSWDLLRIAVSCIIWSLTFPPTLICFHCADGALLVAALGELHLQRCLKELERRFARCKVLPSDPIVNLKETIVGPAPRSTALQRWKEAKEAALELHRAAQLAATAPAELQDDGAAAAAAEPESKEAEVDAGAAKTDDKAEFESAAQKKWLFQAGARLDPSGTATVLSTTPAGDCTIRLRVIPLPDPIRDALTKHAKDVAELRGAGRTDEIAADGSAAATMDRKTSGPEEDDSEPETPMKERSTGSRASTRSHQDTRHTAAARRLRDALLAAAEEAAGAWPRRVALAMEIGDAAVGPNLLCFEGRPDGTEPDGPAGSVAAALTGRAWQGVAGGGSAGSSASSRSGAVTAEGASRSEVSPEDAKRAVMPSLPAAADAAAGLVFSCWGRAGIGGAHVEAACREAASSGASRASAATTGEGSGTGASSGAGASNGGATVAASSASAPHGQASGQDGQAAGTSPWDRSPWRTDTPSGRTALSVLTQGAGAMRQGFELALKAGPLCGEPVWGVCVSVHDVILHGEEWAGALSPAREQETGVASDSSVAMGGSVLGYMLGCTRVGSVLGLESGQRRVVEALYACELHCSAGMGGGGEFLGRLHGVVARRRGEVRSEEVIPGTETFVVRAELPVAESFGFATEVRDRTSGLATSPQMVLARWQVLEQDPYFVPRTAAEREEHGDTLHKG